MTDQYFAYHANEDNHCPITGPFNSKAELIKEMTPVKDGDITISILKEEDIVRLKSETVVQTKITDSEGNEVKVDKAGRLIPTTRSSTISEVEFVAID